MDLAIETHALRRVFGDFVAVDGRERATIKTRSAELPELTELLGDAGEPKAPVLEWLRS